MKILDNTDAKLISLLNRLILIHSGRILGYEVASRETRSLRLQHLFQKMIADSRHFRGELAQEVMIRGGVVEMITTNSEKMNSAWKSLIAAFLRKNMNQCMTTCHLAETLTIATYKAVLKSGTNIPLSLRHQLVGQKKMIDDDLQQFISMGLLTEVQVPKVSVN